MRGVRVVFLVVLAILRDPGAHVSFCVRPIDPPTVDEDGEVGHG